MNKIVNILITAFCAVSLSYGMDPNQELVKATYDRNIGLMQEALNKGADANFKTKDARGNPTIPLLSVVTLASFHESMRLLIENGADVNIQGARGETPLMWARDVEAANILIKAGADVNQKDQEGNTPLHHAAQKGNLDVVKFFLENGADINAQNNNRQYPYDVRDREGNTLLHHAARQGNTDLVRFLLEIGANIKATNKSRQTPYTLAAESNNKEIKKLIAEKAQESQRKYVESIAAQSRRRP